MKGAVFMVRGERVTFVDAKRRGRGWWIVTAEDGKEYDLVTNRVGGKVAFYVSEIGSYACEKIEPIAVRAT